MADSSRSVIVFALAVHKYSGFRQISCVIKHNYITAQQVASLEISKAQEAILQIIIIITEIYRVFENTWSMFTCGLLLSNIFLLRRKGNNWLFNIYNLYKANVSPIWFSTRFSMNNVEWHYFIRSTINPCSTYLISFFKSFILRVIFL